MPQSTRGCMSLGSAEELCVASAGICETFPLVKFIEGSSLDDSN